MKAIYASPVFSNADGSPRIFWVPLEAVATYAKRDAALLKMKEMGGIHAKLTPEFMKVRNAMMLAKRKIERNGWHSVQIDA